MKTQRYVLEAVRGGRKSECLDGRDYNRLTNFFPAKDWGVFGFKLKDGDEVYEPKDWTKQNIVAQLKKDVAFGFEKALDQRGISSSFMYEVVKMWLWILEDELQEMDDYAEYGLPLFKAVAVKYGFDNPIGADSGSERKYSG